MRKNFFLLMLVAILSLVAWWLVSSKKSGTLGKDMREFAVEDTGSIVKIFMADKSGKSVLLERSENGDWNYNGKGLARPDGIKTLLTTIHDVRVKSPVGKNAYNNIIKSLATTGVKVEIFNRDGLVKTYYVGGPDMEHTGTYMYIEGADEPYVIHIPGFEGYLTPRYFLREQDWSVKNIFRLQPSALESLTAVNYEKPGYHITINSLPGGEFEIRDADGNALQGVVHDKVMNYLQPFASLNYEKIESALAAEQLDSLASTAPLRTVSVREKGGKTTVIDFWRRPVTPGASSAIREDGVVLPYDVDRMTARIRGNPEWIVVQYYTYDHLFKRPVDFLVPRPM